MQMFSQLISLIKELLVPIIVIIYVSNFDSCWYYFCQNKSAISYKDLFLFLSFLRSESTRKKKKEVQIPGYMHIFFLFTWGNPKEGLSSLKVKYPGQLARLIFYSNDSISTTCTLLFDYNTSQILKEMFQNGQSPPLPPLPPQFLSHCTSSF